jgi:peptide subunit release factor RF-3
VQANVDPQHRDRIAFLRIATGRFRRGMKLKNIRTGRLMSVQAPVLFLARERNLAEEAWPSDIMGITPGRRGVDGDAAFRDRAQSWKGDDPRQLDVRPMRIRPGLRMITRTSAGVRLSGKS